MTRQLTLISVGLALVATLLVTGCCRPPRSALPETSGRCGAAIPVQGQPAQYTLTPGPRDGARVRHLVLCASQQKRLPHHRIGVQGLGWRRFHPKARAGCKRVVATPSVKAHADPVANASSVATPTRPARRCPEINLHAFLQDVHRALKAQGVVNTGLGITPCCGGLRDAQGRFRGVSVRLHHWKYANAAVGVVAQKVRQWELAETVSVVVAPIPGACAL